MAKFLNDIINRLKIPDDDDMGSYEDEYELEEERERQQKEMIPAAKRKIGRLTAYSDDIDDEEDLSHRKRTVKAPSKIVSFGSGNSKGSNMNIILEKPKGFDDSCAISDKLIEGSSVVLNLEGLDPAIAQRIVDFVFGTLHAISGKYTQVSRYILIFSPQDVELSGEITDLLSQNGLDVPVINKDF